jgi:SAM-dependent methyltransferase
VISSRLYGLVRCPDCGGAVAPAGQDARCASCGRTFDVSSGYLDLRPSATFDEKTKYLDAALHADARHVSIAPPVLGSRVRYSMLRRFLQLGPDDRAIDLGCGSGRALAWTADAGAASVGVDISPYFAREALDGHDLILGDLRRLPIRDEAFTLAWTLDVVEHVSPEALRQVLAEANRVLAPGGALFIYSHVRQNGPIALGVRAINRFAAGLFARFLTIRLKKVKLFSLFFTICAQKINLFTRFFTKCAQFALFFRNITPKTKQIAPISTNFARLPNIPAVALPKTPLSISKRHVGS